MATAEPTNGDDPARVVLPLWKGPRQACFCPPASGAAFQDVAVMEQTVQHRGDGGAVSE